MKDPSDRSAYYRDLLCDCKFVIWVDKSRMPKFKKKTIKNNHLKIKNNTHTHIND